MTVEFPDSTGPLTALLDACVHFATHVNLLADQLRDVELTDDDAERLSDAATRAFTAVALATSLTVGLEREAGDGECPHYNVLTDAEWARLSADETAAHDRSAVYQRELQADHPGSHMSLAQSFDDRNVWLRWADRVRELVDLPPCPASNGALDDPEGCLLFRGHPGEHTFTPGVVTYGREASPKMQRRLDDLLAAE
ncbi:hypothetical protein ABZ260_51390 [Streptosporangium sp. NPDC006013]|uniref:hypothetical protein n=1 Tax=Streptosporangium sp. NPDC006013 TaxID=3155596 RepID=UPI0033AACAAE